MVEFDPYESAKQMGDQASLDSWARYEDALLSAPVIAIKPFPYLQYEHPKETDEYGPVHEIWDESIRQVVGIYEESFAQAFAPFFDAVKLEKRPYTPPSGYAKGAPISFPIDVLQLVYEQQWLIGVGIAVFHDLVSEAVKNGLKKLHHWWDEHNVPTAERVLPSHNPFIVRVLVEEHAHRCYPKLMPGLATIHAAFPLNADYPANGALFLMILPYPKGSLIYLVDDRLWLLSIVRTTPTGSTELDSSGWLSA